MLVRAVTPGTGLAVHYYMGKLLPLCVLGLALTGCAFGDSEPLDDSGFENVGDDTAADRVGDIDWQVRDTPELLELDSPLGDKVAYGECELVEPEDEETDIQIHCTMPWAEVAWYVIPDDVISAGLDSGARTLTASFVVPNSLVRASIHQVDSAGKRTKLTSRSMIFDGESISADLEAATDHYIYVARGSSLLPVWGTGDIQFSVRATLD